MLLKKLRHLAFSIGHLWYFVLEPAGWHLHCFMKCVETCGAVLLLISWSLPLCQVKINSYSPPPPCLPSTVQKKKKHILHASHFYFVNCFLMQNFFGCVNYVITDFFFFFLVTSFRSYQAKIIKKFICSASGSLPYLFIVIVFLVIRHILYASNFHCKIHIKVVFYVHQSHTIQLNLWWQRFTWAWDWKLSDCLSFRSPASQITYTYSAQRINFSVCWKPEQLTLWHLSWIFFSLKMKVNYRFMVTLQQSIKGKAASPL